MQAVSQKQHTSVLDLLDRVIEKEREAILIYQHNANQVNDPDIKNMFTVLANKRYEYFTQIYEELIKLRSENEITAQINDMFQ